MTRRITTAEEALDIVETLLLSQPFGARAFSGLLIARDNLADAIHGPDTPDTQMPGQGTLL